MAPIIVDSKTMSSYSNVEANNPEIIDIINPFSAVWLHCGAGYEQGEEDRATSATSNMLSI